MPWAPPYWHPPMVVDHARKTLMVGSELYARRVREAVPEAIEQNELAVIVSQFVPDGKAYVVDNERQDHELIQSRAEWERFLA